MTSMWLYSHQTICNSENVKVFVTQANGTLTCTRLSSTLRHFTGEGAA